MFPLEMLSVIVVFNIPAPVVPGLEFGAPLPMIVIPIPLGIVSPEVHVHAPAGN